MKLPEKIGNWTMEPGCNATYHFNSKTSVLATISSSDNYETGVIAFGAYRPCGVNFGKKSYNSLEELITILETTNHPNYK